MDIQILSIKKKGFVLIEALVSILLVSILVATSFNIIIKASNIKKNNTRVKKDMYFMEFLKKDILYNETFEEIEKLKNYKEVYIVEKNMEAELFKTKGLKDIVSLNKPSEDNYISISIKGDAVLLMNVTYKNSYKNIKFEVFKGRYYWGVK